MPQTMEPASQVAELVYALEKAYPELVKMADKKPIARLIAKLAEYSEEVEYAEEDRK